MTKMGDQMDHDCKAAVKMKLIQLLKIPENTTKNIKIKLVTNYYDL